VLILFVYGTFTVLSTGTMAGYMHPRYRASKGNEPPPPPMPQTRQIHICDDSNSNEHANERDPDSNEHDPDSNEHDPDSNEHDSLNGEGPNASLTKQKGDFNENGDDVTDKVMTRDTI
jgi:hypothetical protein